MTRASASDLPSPVTISTIRREALSLGSVSVMRCGGGEVPPARQTWAAPRASRASWIETTRSRAAWRARLSASGWRTSWTGMGLLGGRVQRLLGGGELLVCADHVHDGVDEREVGEG